MASIVSDQAKAGSRVSSQRFLPKRSEVCRVDATVSVGHQGMNSVGATHGQVRRYVMDTILESKIGQIDGGCEAGGSARVSANGFLQTNFGDSQCFGLPPSS